jgi:hypothetical protein
MSDYDGPRTGDGIVDFMLKKFRNVHFLPLRLQTNVLEEVQVDIVMTAIAQDLDSMRRMLSY